MSRGLHSLRLDCPRCAARCQGGVAASLLLCPACAEAREVRLGGATFRLVFAGVTAQARAVALPFFRFRALKVRARALSPAGGRAVERLAGVSDGWVLGLRVRRFENYGDGGLEYTRRGPRLEACAPLRVIEPTRTRRDAETVLGVHLFRLGSEVAPPGSFALDADPGEPEIWAVATIEDHDHLKLPHATVRYPVTAVEGYPPPA